MKKKIIYFNINYSCNNKCIFCYSHNTINKISSKNLSFNEFKNFIEKNQLTEADRIIINGGEPSLHKEVNQFLEYVSLSKIETLFFSNGRILKNLNTKFLTSNIRFVIPIHGTQKIHDYITGISGSFEETLSSMEWLKNNAPYCKVDLKIILNNETIKDEQFISSINTWKKVPFNNTVHITMMADTKISKFNNCESLPLDKVSELTVKLTKEFENKCAIKIYGTCVCSFLELKSLEFKKIEYDLELYYKDSFVERNIELKNKGNKCDSICFLECTMRKFCLSEVDQYKVLKIFKNKIYESME